jgi:hypothetical protein
MEEIKRLVEERQIMASKKKISSKLNTVVTSMGSSVYGDSGYGAGYSSNAYETESCILPPDTGEDIQIAHDADCSDIGYLYDALRLGHNFEILYLKYERQLRAKYNGYIVYLEEEGKLKAYVPNPVWEELLDRIYLKAKIVEEDNQKQTKIENEKGFMKHASKFMKELRESWGI